MSAPKLKTWEHNKQVVLGTTPTHPNLKGTGDHPLVVTFVHPQKAREVADAFVYAVEALERIAAMENAGPGETQAVALGAMAKLYRVMP